MCVRPISVVLDRYQHNWQTAKVLAQLVDYPITFTCAQYLRLNKDDKEVGAVYDDVGNFQILSLSLRTTRPITMHSSPWMLLRWYLR